MLNQLMIHIKIIVEPNPKIPAHSSTAEPKNHLPF